MRRTAILFIGVLACAAFMAPPASAGVQPAGTGEPLFTNSTQNTQWFEWGATSGVDAYRIRYDSYENNVSRRTETVEQPNGNAGAGWASWSGVATLQHGAQYGICAQGSYSFPNDSLFFPDGPNSCSMGTLLGRRAYTTIDRSKPTAALELASGRAFVNDARIPVRVDFADDVAGPFPANFLCFDVGGGLETACDRNAGEIYGYNAACSVPGSPGKSTTFSCTADYGAVADGNVWACVIAADASIPDNPSGSNQTASADKANLSNATCDGVVVDRTPPTVAIAASSASVKVGELVSFQAAASDATSGLAGAGQWTWGDNAGGGSGDAVAHTFTQPGTFEVALTVTDAAGNAATARKAISVTPTPPPGDDGASDPVDDGTSDPDPPSLELDAPRKARVRAKSIPVELTASDSGRVQLALTRGARAIARAGVTLDEDGTADYRLKLPRGSKAGRYTLKATYKPAAGQPITATRKITLTGKTSARRAAITPGPEIELGRGPRALPDGRFHGDRPARTFKVR